MNNLRDYEKGKNSIDSALDLYPENSDAIQRRCELEFLKGKPLESIRLAEKNSIKNLRFWGLSYGKDFFKIYCYLHMGNFQKATGIAKSPIITSNSLEYYLKGVIALFSGSYSSAAANLREGLEKLPGPYTLAELRLFYSRAALLSEKDPRETSFFFEDLVNNSLTYSHQAEISVAYFKAKEKKHQEAEEQAKSAFEKVLKISVGDFDTRLWLFYDAYVYGKTMEMVGNTEEAVRGYRECVRANPHTDLAKRSEKALKNLMKTAE